MHTATPNFVLRSVYVRPGVDEALRTYAFFTRRAKAELIRASLTLGLRALRGRMEGITTPEEAMRVGNEFCSEEAAFSREIERTVREDLARLQGTISMEAGGGSE